MQENPDRHSPLIGTPLGPMTRHQINATNEFLGKGSTISDGPTGAPRVELSDEHYAWAQEEMERELAQRAAGAARHLVDRTTSVNPSVAGPRRAEHHSAPYGLTAEEIERGQQWHHIIEKGSTGENGPSFIFAKFDHGSVEGLPFNSEYMTAVTDNNGRYRSGVYFTHLEDLQPAGIIDQSLASIDHLRDTSFLTTYPAPSDPTKIIVNYSTWQSTRSVKNKTTLPGDAPMSFVFTIPATELSSFLDDAAAHPRILEAILQLSPYGPLMHERGGPMIRNHADKLAIINLENPSHHNFKEARFRYTVATAVKRDQVPIVAIDPPLGDVPPFPPIGTQPHS